jgi:CubicO group peptidase (beta-lactamase class C family)
MALSQEPVGPKGETYAYSNNGYIVVGAMLEAATGTPWEELVRQKVFEPLGMTRAGFGAPVARNPDHPCGHVPGGPDGSDRPVRIGGDNPAPLGPAGRVHMPLADMARYLAAHASRSVDFLSTESWETLHTVPFTGNYAMGWVAIGPEQRWHNGSNTMWYAEIIFHRDGRAAAVVVNDGAIQAVQPAVRALLGRLMENGS